MKSLKEFITENLENSTITTVDENQKIVIDTTSEKTVAENAEVIKTEENTNK